MVRLLVYVAMLVLTVVSFVITRMRSAAHQADKSRATAPSPLDLHVDTPQALDAALRHTDWRVRQAAILKLGEQAAPEATTRLIAALNDEDSDVRQSASDMLVAHGVDAIEALSVVLENGSLNARQLAAASLGEIGAGEGVPALIASLKDNSLWVRSAAADALGKINDSAAVDDLIAALHDPEKEVTDAAARALRRIGTADALAALEN